MGFFQKLLDLLLMFLLVSVQFRQLPLRIFLDRLLFRLRVQILLQILPETGNLGRILGSLAGLFLGLLLQTGDLLLFVLDLPLDLLFRLHTLGFPLCGSFRRPAALLPGVLAGVSGLKYAQL